MKKITEQQLLESVKSLRDYMSEAGAPATGKGPLNPALGVNNPAMDPVASGASPIPAVDFKTASRVANAEQAAKAAVPSVMAKPTWSPMQANIWDRDYGKTHNPDGSPKITPSTAQVTPASTPISAVVDSGKRPVDSNGRPAAKPLTGFSKDVTALATINKIANPNAIRVGQKLTLVDGSTYVIAPGDTLSGIASGRYKGVAPQPAPVAIPPQPTIPQVQAGEPEPAPAPEPTPAPAADNTVKSGSGETWKDGSGNPIRTGTDESVTFSNEDSLARIIQLSR